MIFVFVVLLGIAMSERNVAATLFILLQSIKQTRQAHSIWYSAEY